MLRILLALVPVILTFTCWAQNATPDLAQVLNFEAGPAGDLPSGWGGGPAGTIFIDAQTVHGGRWSGRVERTARSEGEFSSLTRVVPMNFGGTTVEFRGFLRLENVSGFAAFWMREDGESEPVAFESMQSRGLKGTIDWAEYSISLPVKPDARNLYIGVLVSGAGKAWADDLQLLVDGKPVWQAPAKPQVETVLDRDHNFDGGSRISLETLTPVQIRDLALLGKVWGFLKYHHPAVVAGERHWDYDLFRILPAVLAAPDAAAARSAIDKWIDALGEVAPCEPCATLDENQLHLRPRLEWLSDERLLGPGLSRRLQSIHHNRPAAGKQFFVRLNPGVGNAVLNHEPGYQSVKLPDAGYQLLSLFRLWNIVEYWFPYRDVIGEDWDKVLLRFIPRLALAKDRDAYRLEVLALLASINDTHANLWNSLDARPPVGTGKLPLAIRFVGNRAVVTGYTASVVEADRVLRPGDVIHALDGTLVSEFVKRWSPYYAASNDARRLSDIAQSMGRGPAGEAVDLSIRRGDESFKVAMKRLPLDVHDVRVGATHDLPGPAFRLLSNDVAYLKLSAVQNTEVPKYIESAAKTRGLIIDIRNYPSQFVVFTLGSLLVNEKTPFVRFTAGDPANPGAFRFTPPLTLSPREPHYAGKVVVLVDETSLSQAEYTAMALRSAPGAIVLGGTTAGADGNVSRIALPGGLQTGISGIGVFYPDKRPTQRVGIVPDVVVHPTIEGIRDGRDEVLEEAIRRIVGPGIAEADIRKMSRP